LGGAHYDREKTFNSVKKEILNSFQKLNKMESKMRIDARRNKFIKMGVFFDEKK